jgi:hypothetical protein
MPLRSDVHRRRLPRWRAGPPWPGAGPTPEQHQGNRQGHRNPAGKRQEGAVRHSDHHNPTSPPAWVTGLEVMVRIVGP